MTTKPDAEIVGSFENVMRRGKCDDGRSLFVFRQNGEEKFVLAGSELLTWKALQPGLGTVERMTKGKMSDRVRQEYLKHLDGQDGETKEAAETDGGAQ